MAWTRAALALVVAGAVAVALFSGGDGADPRTPAALPGLPPPFLGTAVVGSGGLTAALDAYGDVVDLRPGPAGRALIDNPAARQAAGTVAAATGIVPRVSVGGGPALALWQADSVSQRFLAGSNVVRTTGRFGAVRADVLAAVDNRRLALLVRTRGGGADPSVSVDADGGACASAERQRTLALICMASAVPLSPELLTAQPPGVSLAVRAGGSPFLAAAEAIVARQRLGDRAWLAAARPLGGAPPWARAMYRRSLLTLRALTDHGSGAVAAGARDGWAYVWPRDAATAAIAFAAAGYRAEADRATRFLLGAGLEQAARFHGDGSPVPGRPAQGDALGWAAAAAEASGSIGSARHAARILAGGGPVPWRHRADYWEGEPGDYLGNALSAHAGVSEFRSRPPAAGAGGATAGLVRVAGDPGSGLDSAAAWAVRPFPRPRLYPAARATLLRLASERTRFGITPGAGWPGGEDPWSAPTAWTAWSLAALGERGPALQLIGALRRSATPAGALPERVEVRSGVPSSTTPLAWSHAFAILALRQLWP